MRLVSEIPMSGKDAFVIVKALYTHAEMCDQKAMTTPDMRSLDRVAIRKEAQAARRIASSFTCSDVVSKQQKMN